MDKDTVLVVKNIIKYYGNQAYAVKAVDNISFTVERGEFVAVMGASGSGKTTLLNLLSTIDSPSSGDIIYSGKNVAEMSEDERSDFRRDQLGFIFQQYNLLENMTIEENISLPLNLRKCDHAKTSEDTMKVMNKLGISELACKFPNELSGGERQRVACARALITSPQIIMADEPTGALDSANSKNLMNLIYSMNKEENVSVLMVTHDPVIGSYSGRVLFLKDGQIWNEIYRGDRSRKEFYNEIITVTSAAGGDTDVY